MSHRRKFNREEKKKLKKVHECDQRLLARNDLTKELAAMYSCLHTTICNFEHQCDTHLENLTADISFSELAQEIWKDRPGHAQLFHQLLSELVQARKEFQLMLGQFKKRFEALKQPVTHEHLEPRDFYEDLAQRILFPDELIN